MFSQGQWIFAGCFLVSFIAVMIYAYRKDMALHKVFYKGNYKILLVFLFFIGFLFFVKKYLKH